eukprot:s1344_g6.t1
MILTLWLHGSCRILRLMIGRRDLPSFGFCVTFPALCPLMDADTVACQAAEIEALQAIYEQEFELVEEAQEGSRHGASFRIRCPPVGPVLVNLPSTYPASGHPSFTAERLRGSQAAAVQEGLVSVARELAGQECVFQVLSTLPEVASLSGVEDVEEAPSSQLEISEKQEPGHWATESADGTVLSLSVRSGPKVKTSRITNTSELRRVTNVGSICIDLATSRNTENYELANLLATCLQIKAEDVEFLVGKPKDKASGEKQALIRSLTREEAHWREPYRTVQNQRDDKRLLGSPASPILKPQVSTASIRFSRTLRFSGRSYVLSGLQAACPFALVFGGLGCAGRSSISMPSAPSLPANSSDVVSVDGVDKRRCRRLNKVPMAKDSTGPVIYWMSRDQRVEDNWALLYAQKLALQRSASVHVVFCLVPKFGDATIRQFDFLLGGLKEVAAGLKAKNIPFHLKIGKAVTEIPALLDELKATALVCDMSPLRVPKQWAQDVAEACQAKEIHIALTKQDWGPEDAEMTVGPEQMQPLSSDAVAISFKIRGVTLEPLLQAKPLMKATKKALRAALAQECGQGIGTEHVAVSLSEGSLIVDANIWPPPSISCAFVKDRLKSSSTLLDTIQTWVSEVPNLDKVLTGPVRVSKSSVSVSIIRSGGEMEDISHEATSDLHSSQSLSQQRVQARLVVVTMMMVTIVVTIVMVVVVVVTAIVALTRKVSDMQSSTPIDKGTGMRISDGQTDAARMQTWSYVSTERENARERERERETETKTKRQTQTPPETYKQIRMRRDIEDRDASRQAVRKTEWPAGPQPYAK